MNVPFAVCIVPRTGFLFVQKIAEKIFCTEEYNGIADAPGMAGSFSAKVKKWL